MLPPRALAAAAAAAAGAACAAPSTRAAAPRNLALLQPVLSTAGTLLARLSTFGQLDSFETYGEENRAKDRSIEFGPRRAFKPKETYLPRDLNDRNVDKFIKKLGKPPVVDELKKLGIDPLKEYKNTQMLSHYVTTIGLIKPRSQTGLTAANQRKVARAIRRARAMGLMPFTYREQISS